MLETRFYNSLTQKKEPFVPIDPEHIKLYVCGPTIYDHIHIGNARPIIVFDVLYRFLQTQYHKVSYVRNITDVDDKIIARAKEKNISAQSLVSTYLRHFQEVVSSLNTLPPTIEPRATEHISQMIIMIDQLLKKGHAYIAEDHVLFSVSSSQLYGQLSHRNLEEMRAGARVKVASYKKHPADFVLWKPVGNEQPSWNSPWGVGRPGWHLECSAMASYYLGEKIDIHGGGRDLLFPHHENERIQSCCAHGNDEFANYWLHNGYVTMSGEKMSKSVGNILHLNALLNQISPEVIRFLLLSTHYTKPLEWSDLTIAHAVDNVKKFYEAFVRYGFDWQDGNICPTEDLPSTIEEKIQHIQHALADDLSTPLALSVLHQLLQGAHKSTTHKDRHRWLSGLKHGGHLLGIFGTPVNKWSNKAEVNVNVDYYLEQRQQARLEKNYAKADEIRNYLLSKNIAIEDTPEGTLWQKI